LNGTLQQFGNLKEKYAKKGEQCRYCGGEVQDYLHQCALSERKRKRKVRGFNAWKPGSKGRIPYVKAGE
jgi:hypothetical protein